MENMKITAMSYNLRYDTGEGGVARMHALVSQINHYSPDIFGVQEETPAWKGFFSVHLNPKYARVGEGRRGASDQRESNEAAAVYFDTQKFELLHTVTKWLSATPDVPSYIEGAHFPRSVTFAVLKYRANGNKLVFANTHFDCSTDAIREEESRCLSRIRHDFGDLPFIISGDFNSQPNSPAYNLVCEDGLQDVSLVAPDSKIDNTFHGYGTMGVIIDYFFANEKIKPLTYRVLSEKWNGEYTSDHYPITVCFDIENKIGG
jgi:endonuclease/exonuclease/phosphatase family metal-dependent hydrolase